MVVLFFPEIQLIFKMRLEEYLEVAEHAVHMTSWQRQCESSAPSEEPRYLWYFLRPGESKESWKAFAQLCKDQWWEDRNSKMKTVRDLMILENSKVERRSLSLPPYACPLNEVMEPWKDLCARPLWKGHRTIMLSGAFPIHESRGENPDEDHTERTFPSSFVWVQRSVICVQLCKLYRKAPGLLFYRYFYSMYVCVIFLSVTRLLSICTCSQQQWTFPHRREISVLE